MAALLLEYAAAMPHTSPVRNARLVARVVRDFTVGFRTLRAMGPCVTVFGSARTAPSDPSYAAARALGRRLVESGFGVVTGGGPGAMEAANRGAREAGGPSIGCNIRLPVEQQPNAYVDRLVTCRHFFVRKVLLFRYSSGFVALPGGLGTMDELFEALTLVQTGKIDTAPIVLLGEAYWQPLLDFMGRMARHGTIDTADLQLVKLTDDVDAAVAHIERHGAIEGRWRDTGVVWSARALGPLGRLASRDMRSSTPDVPAAVFDSGSRFGRGCKL